MIKKGLCSTCVNDKNWSLPRKFPVLQREKLSSYEPGFTEIKKIEQKKIKFDKGQTIKTHK